MMTPKKVFYTATAHATGGRNGHTESEDGVVSHDLSLPASLAGSHKAGTTTPEDLFAAGYAACFGSAIEFFARTKKADATGSVVTAKVGIGELETGGWGLTVDLTVKLPNVEPKLAAEIVELAHKGCPYSNATRGNIPVTVALT